VLEASAPSAAPLEVQVTRTPDGEAMGSAPEPSDIAQPLTLEPTTGKPGAAGDRNAPTTPSAHLDCSDSRRALDIRPTQASAFPQGGAYRYAPEIGAHVVRSDRQQSGQRPPRGRLVR
jgi:hypothetical protein